MARWTFLRHGQSTANAEGWLSGHRDVPLTARGREQARQAAALLAPIPYGQIWSSDLRRAVQTARIVCAGRDGPPLRTSPLLRERKLGILEGRDKAELRASGQMARLLGWEYAPEGGESHRDLARRAIPFLASIDTGEDTLVVAHGGLIRVLVGRIDGLEPAAIGRVAYANAIPIHRELPRGAWAALIPALSDAAEPPCAR